MEDLSHSGFIKLQDVLVSGDVAAHLPAIEGALTFIGRVHSATWLEEVESSKRRELIDNHRSVNHTPHPPNPKMHHSYPPIL